MMLRARIGRYGRHSYARGTAFERAMRPCSSGGAWRDSRSMTNWEYLVVPLNEASGLKKSAADFAPKRLNELGAQGWEAVGLTLKKGDLVAWPVVLLKRPSG